MNGLRFMGHPWPSPDLERRVPAVALMAGVRVAELRAILFDEGATLGERGEALAEMRIWGGVLQDNTRNADERNEILEWALARRLN